MAEILPSNSEEENIDLSPNCLQLIEELGNAINNFPSGKPLHEAIIHIQTIFLRLKQEYNITLKPISLNSIEIK